MPTERILEDWRIKDGKVEAPMDPFSSTILVNFVKEMLFTQKVYEKFDKVKRHGKLMRRRTVAGRVVKESYDKAK